MLELANASNSTPNDYIIGFFVVIIILAPIVIGFVLLLRGISSIFKRMDTRGKLNSRKLLKILITLSVILIIILWVYFYGHGALLPSFQYQRRI
jgi:uncharacterized membrane protein